MFIIGQSWWLPGYAWPAYSNYRLRLFLWLEAPNSRVNWTWADWEKAQRWIQRCVLNTRNDTVLLAIIQIANNFNNMPCYVFISCQMFYGVSKMNTAPLLFWDSCSSIPAGLTFNTHVMKSFWGQFILNSRLCLAGCFLLKAHNLSQHTTLAPFWEDSLRISFINKLWDPAERPVSQRWAKKHQQRS